jgi:hypothetical protein
MAVPQRRGRLITIQELLEIQRDSVPTRCSHCRRDSTDRDHERVQAALRARIRTLEIRLSELERKLPEER